MVIINNNSGLTEAHYNGTELTQIYVGEHLVWPVQPTPPISTDKVKYTLSSETYTIACDGNDNVTYNDIINDMRERGFSVSDMSGITDVELGNCINEIGQLCFADCYSLSSMTIPSSVSTLGYSSFSNCHSLSSLTIPSVVRVIPSHFIFHSENLVTLNIPYGVTEIGTNAFYDCLSYLDITIPSTVTTIGDSAFRTSYWTQQDREYYDKMMILKDDRVIRCMATVPPTIGTLPFSIITGSSDIATYKIYVPSESVEAYKTAWNYYANRIYPIG